MLVERFGDFKLDSIRHVRQSVHMFVVVVAAPATFAPHLHARGWTNAARRACELATVSRATAAPYADAASLFCDCGKAREVVALDLTQYAAARAFCASCFPDTADLRKAVSAKCAEALKAENGPGAVQAALHDGGHAADFVKEQKLQERAAQVSWNFEPAVLQPHSDRRAYEGVVGSVKSRRTPRGTSNAYTVQVETEQGVALLWLELAQTPFDENWARVGDKVRVTASLRAGKKLAIARAPEMEVL